MRIIKVSSEAWEGERMSLNTLTSHESTTEKEEEEEESNVGNRKEIEMEVCTRWNL